MEGAREYAELFHTGQYGNFYIVSGYHARGKTFHIQVLPQGEKAKPNGPNSLCLNENAVEVYGVTGGCLGWTETYGWLYEGSWCKDFKRLVCAKRASIEADKERVSADYEKQQKEETARKKALLSQYQSFDITEEIFERR